MLFIQCFLVFCFIGLISTSTFNKKRRQVENEEESSEEAEGTGFIEVCDENFKYDTLGIDENNITVLKDHFLWVITEDGVSNKKQWTEYPRSTVPPFLPVRADAILRNLKNEGMIVEGQNYWEISPDEEIEFEDIIIRAFPSSLDIFSPFSDMNAVFITESEGKRRMFFFSHGLYWRMTEGSEKVDPGFPKFIWQDFPGVPNEIDAAFEWKNDLLFFKGDSFWNFDRVNNVLGTETFSVRENIFKCSSSSIPITKIL